jgi:hypothetical protein
MQFVETPLTTCQYFKKEKNSPHTVFQVSPAPKFLELKIQILPLALWTKILFISNCCLLFCENSRYLLYDACDSAVTCLSSRTTSFWPPALVMGLILSACTRICLLNFTWTTFTAFLHTPVHTHSWLYDKCWGSGTRAAGIRNYLHVTIEPVNKKRVADADPDPGSWIRRFLTPGSGISFFKIPDPRSNPYFWELSNTILG